MAFGKEMEIKPLPEWIRVGFECPTLDENGNLDGHAIRIRQVDREARKIWLEDVDYGLR